jgi:hypothetical protein
MANEIITVYQPTKTLYYIIVDNDGLVWDGNTFVSIDSDNWGDYNLPLSENGTSTGVYIGDFSTAITSESIYNIVIYNQEGGVAAVSDSPPIALGQINWDGTQESGEVDISDLASSLSDILKVVQAIRRN